MRDWRNGIALARGEDGAFAATLDLPAGVYQYKLIVDGRWALDASNARTRSAGGQRNNVLVVEGAAEPFLFAPVSPWVDALERGGVRVMVGLRKNASADASADAVRIAFSEDGGATWSHVGAERAFSEDEHEVFVATLPTSAQTLVLRVDGGGASFDARWTRPRASERLPAWWKKAVLYTVFVDRFRPAADGAHDGAAWQDPGQGLAAGGHIEGIRRSLEDLAQLGVDTLYLTPVHVGASAHRYDLVDPLSVDPALGGEAAYDALVRDAAAAGMSIVQDISFAHAGRGFPAYEDVLVNGRSSRFASWFVWKDGALVHYGKRTDAPLLDLDDPSVQALALDAVAYWAKRGARGLRLDMTAEVPFALGRRLRKRFRELRPDGVVFGEVVPQHVWRWRAEGVIDAATDFGFHEIVTELVCDPRASARAAYEKLRRIDLLRGGDPIATSVRFLSTHDHPRLATRAAERGMLGRLPLAHVLLATWPGIPMFLYGEELGLRSDSGAAARELEDVWPDRMPMPWVAGRGSSTVRGLVAELLRVRASSTALRSGELTLLFADESTLVYRRQAEGDIVDVVLNFADEPKTITLEDDDWPTFKALSQTPGSDVNGAVVQLPAFGALVGRRERALGRAVAPARARRNLVLRDRELAEGRVTVDSLPSRFFFSVTERCNLRCAHCITHAPELTESGAARTMTPAVLDALREHLGLGTYFAFVHGGESLTAPILFDVLGAIKAARGAEPYVAHLLSNGVLLGARAAERLVRAGVSSISISLDGATASTNDRIRVGGRFDDVIANLEDVLAWRRGEGIDLRVGLSFVVLGQNVHELGAFVELAARLGVDWVKLEEGVPATEFARTSLVSCTSSVTRAAIDAAVARGGRHGLVMVDHTVDRAIWRCRLDDDTRAFLAADEHANRSEIHPCRTAWETVCVEPNGDLRVTDFFGPIVGNVTRATLGELWNAPAAFEARERSKSGRLCGPSGPVTCLARLAP
ncbi:MAG: cyclomaltodextrinase / maltogenic alpha-amylase / neopullulanase [Myxococcales bacterium]|nr:cyclomaltodextrinase / maltogenic alpha-amylase / neopullulanase [Myxococcales bacterium]